MGYALPGAVLAVGAVWSLSWLDHRLADALGADRLLLSNTLAALLLAYLVRFLAVGHGPLEAGLQAISRSMDEAARTLGEHALGRLRRIHLPLLRRSLGVAAALVFVDLMKELPITLMTRPFGWDTLAVRVFEMTSEGEWERAALPAVAIALVGMLPVFLLIRHADARR
jgi:iron(III) transport system permease protein